MPLIIGVRGMFSPNFALTEFYEVRKAVRNGSCMSNRKNTYSR